MFINQLNGAHGPECGVTALFQHTEHMAKLMQRDDLLPTKDAEGTQAGYEQYQRALLRFSNHPASAQTYFAPGTDPAVSVFLERARISRSRIRLFYGDPQTGKDACVDKDVVGKVGRSRGTMQKPMLVTNNDSTGMEIPTARIIRIIDITLQVEYRHPKYQVPNLWQLPACSATNSVDVYHLRKSIARFVSAHDAEHWIAFIQGKIPEILHKSRLQQAA